MINILPLNDDHYDPLQLSLSSKKKFLFDVRNLDSDLDFKFCTSLRSICIRDRASEIYNLATENLDYILDVGTLFEKYSEISMIKELIFDQNQGKLFEMLSKFINVKQLFQYMSDDSDTEENESNNNEEMFKIVKELEIRGSKFDKKLLGNLKLLFKISQ